MDLKIIVFFLLFASVVFGLYFCLPKKYRYIVLLVFSIVFYAIYSKFLTFFLLSTIVTIYCAGLWMNDIDKRCNKKREGKEKEEKKKIKAQYRTRKLLVLWLFIAINLSFLILIKYFGFIGSVYQGFMSWFNVSAKWPVLKIALPLGISYYTLSAIGYMIDIERGKYAGEKNPLKVALFVSFFPQMQEGPFATYDALGPQLCEGHEFDLKRVTKGMMLICWGFLKKIVVADRFAIIASAIFKDYASVGGLAVVWGILSFTIQMYAEFSGIIDIARGISEMFGINLAKNFEQPFFSQTVSEFWRRWHMSLGAWFREYVFYSISMSKGMTKMNKKLHGKVNSFFEMFIPSVIALFFVWLLNGLWHGADVKYIVYGLYWYVIMVFGMCIEPLFNLIYKKANWDKNRWWFKYIRIARTFILVNIGFLMFRANTLSDFGGMFVQIFKGGKVGLVGLGIIDVYDLVWCFIGLAMIVAVDVLMELKVDIREKLASKTGMAFLSMLCMFAIILMFGAYGEGYIPPDPIYGAF